MHLYYTVIIIGLWLAIFGACLLLRYGLPGRCCALPKGASKGIGMAESHAFLGRVGLVLVFLGYMVQFAGHFLN